MSNIYDKNSVNLAARDLKTLGLEHNSALVYLALLKLGETGTGPIIKETSLHGQYVYRSLEDLEKEGLVQHVIKRGRRKYSAKSPRVLVQMAEVRKVQAEALATKLNEMAVLPPDQTFEVYQGAESFIAHEMKMLQDAIEGSELLIIGGVSDKFNQIMGSHLAEYSKLQMKKNIKIRYIGSEADKDKISATHGGRNNFSIRYFPGTFSGQVHTSVWPDAMSFSIHGEPVTSFTIFSPAVASGYKQFFEALWNVAKK